MLTAMGVIFYAMLGTVNWGVPFTVSAIMIVIVLLVSVVEFAKIKRRFIKFS